MSLDDFNILSQKFPYYPKITLSLRVGVHV